MFNFLTNCLHPQQSHKLSQTNTSALCSITIWHHMPGLDFLRKIRWLKGHSNFKPDFGWVEGLQVWVHIFAFRCCFLWAAVSKCWPRAPALGVSFFPPVLSIFPSLVLWKQGRRVGMTFEYGEWLPMDLTENQQGKQALNSSWYLKNVDDLSLRVEYCVLK